MLRPATFNVNLTDDTYSCALCLWRGYPPLSPIGLLVQIQTAHYANTRHTEGEVETGHQMNIPPRLGCAVFTAGAKWHVEAIPTPCSLPTAVGQERKKADPTSKDEGQPKCFHNGIILIVICLKFYLQR